MKLTDIGEKGIIKRLTSFLEIGDDAFYLRYGAGYLVMTTDMVYKKTHLLPGMTWEQIGKFIVTVNLSDIAAMGAKPIVFLLSYGGPDMEVEEFYRLLHSVDEQCKRYGVVFGGGDTNHIEGLTLSGFCVGMAEKPLLRSTARVGDLVAVTGYLGGASLGTHTILKNLRHRNPDVTRRALEPQARVDEGIFLNNYATAMTDISDSLAVSIHEIAEMSGVGFRIFTDKLPVTDSVMNLVKKLDLNIREYTIYGGGDYELLFTISEEDFEGIKNKIHATRIGEVIKRGIFAIGDEGEFRIDKRGYEHFVKEDKKQ